MNHEKFEIFSQTYRTCLLEAMTANPRDYMCPPEDGIKVATKMLAAMEKDTSMVNYTGSGFRRTCKALGIRHTKKGILEYLEVC